MFELRETGDWDIFLGPPERARAETSEADQWVLKRRELPGFAIVNGKNARISGIPIISFQSKLYSQTWGLFLSEHRRCSFLGFIPTNKQTNKGRRSIVFRVLFQQTNKQTNKQTNNTVPFSKERSSVGHA